MKAEDRAEEHGGGAAVGEMSRVKPDAYANRCLEFVCHLILGAGIREMVQPRGSKKHTDYYPRKYYAGLSKTKKAQRRREIARFGAKDTADASAYVGFKTDVGVKTRTSGYTQTLKRRFASMGIEGTQTLRNKAKITGVPYGVLKECYDRGLAAWRTGHLPGATQQQWGHARVASLLVCGKTHYGPDADLVRKGRSGSRRAGRWWKGC